MPILPATILLAVLSTPDLGAYLRTIDGFSGPRALAAAIDGSLLIADTDGSALYRVGLDGTPIRLALPTQLNQPAGVATTKDNRIVVADSGSHRVLLFKGESSITIGRLGSAPGEFHSPTDVDTDGTRIVVADTGNHRVQVLDMEGRVLAVLGSWGTEKGRFRRPGGVAIDGDRVLVADTGNHRVQALNLDGSVQWTSGQWGSFPGLFSEPTGIDVHEDMIVVADRLNHRIQVLDRDGAFVSYWGMHAVKPRQGEGRIHYPDDVAISDDGTEVAVIEGFEDRLQIFGLRNNEVPGTTDPTRKTGVQSHFGNLIALDGRALFLWEPAARSILVFDISHETPIHVSTFGRPGTAPDAFDDVVSLAYYADTSLLEVVDAGTREIKVFHVTMPPSSAPRYDPTAVRLAETRPLLEDPDRLEIERDMASVLMTDGSQFLADWTNDVVLHMRGQQVLHTIGQQGIDHGELWEPRAIAIDKAGRLFVVDHGNHRVQAFAQDGAWLMTFGTGRAWTPATLPKKPRP